MTKKQFRTLFRLLIVLSLLLVGMTSFAVGKYVQDVSLSDNSVTFTANLAAEVIVQEHLAVRQTDGSYELVTQEYADRIANDNFEKETFTAQNTYILLPGLDIPKDPHIIITGKTDIPAFLYVEVIDTLNVVGGEKTVSYQMDANWEALNVPGANGGQVYYYNQVIDDKFTQYPIFILNEKANVTVSHNLLTQSFEDGAGNLRFNVMLIQQVENENAQTTYK